MFESKVKLHILIKLVGYAKFESRESESREFSGSPIVGEILADLKKKLNNSLGKETFFNVEINTPFGRTLLDSVKWNLSETVEWNNMTNLDKIEYIKDLASPYILNQQILHDLFEFANLKHENGSDTSNE